MIVDLSVSFDKGMALIDGDPPPKVTLEASITEHGVNMQMVSMLNHIGTHIDAPAHMIDGGKTLGSYPIDKFVGPGKVIDVSGGYDRSMIASVGVSAGDIVLIYNSNKTASEPPEMPMGFAQGLIDIGIKMIGVESITLDDAESFPLHKVFLAADVMVTESLTNLDQLIGKDFTIYALPLRIDLDGAPARVIAEVKAR